MGNGKKWTGVALACAVLLFAATVVQAQDEGGRRRGFMVQFGIGWAFINYGDAYNAALDSLQTSGVDRIDLALNASLGAAVGQNVYILAIVDAFSTRLFDSYGGYIQVNSYLLGVGLRIYPFHTGLVLGLDGGVAMMAEDDFGTVSDYPTGWGAAASIAWDFNRRATGLSVLIGAKLHYQSIDYAPVLTSVTAVSIFVDLAWK
jgi:hypothetical protein